MKKIYLCTFYVLAAFAIDIATPQMIYAQDASAQAATVQAQSAVPAAAIQPAALVAPKDVVVPEPAAPPAWASEVLLFASKLPVVGPILSKALMYLGILAAILTTLMATALSIISTLKGVLNLAGLDNAVAALQTFRNSKFMYWLLYFSNFNAQKKPTTK